METKPWFVELRVHGVSGTPPSALVGAAEVDEVAGDDLACFVRPRSRAQRGLPGGGELEGMSWGRLTSGPAVQVAWLLLLPFALANLAFWARAGTAPLPGAATVPAPATEAGTGGGRDAAFRGVVRLSALTLTVVFTLTIAHLSIDLVAWQCAGGTPCAVVSGPLDFAATWRVGVRVAVAAAVPVLVLGAVTWLSHRVSLRYEAVATRDPAEAASASGQRVAEPGREDLPRLDSPLMWRGEALVARLRCLHLSAAWATVALLLVAGLLPLFGRTPPAGAVVAWLAAGLGAVGVLLVCAARSLRRSDWVRWSDAGLPGQRREAAALQWTALASAVLAAVAHGTAQYGATPPAAHPALPGLAELLTAAAALQFGLLLLLGLSRVRAGLSALWRSPRLLRRRGRAGGNAHRRPVAPAPFVLATSAAGLGFVYSSGAALRVADLLDGDSPVELHVPVFLRWVAAGFAVGVGLGLLALLFALWWVSRVPEGDAWRVAEDYRVPRSRGPDWLERLRDDYRVRRIVHARRLQRAVQVRAIFRVLVGLALLSMIVAAAALSYVALGWSVGPGPATWGDRLASAGGWAVTGVVVGLVVVAVAGWRSEAWRRRIGILWDVLSFWPRGAHPLAPPSYTERAVPQLVARICHLARAGTRSPRAPRVVLSGHSQGAVISAAVVAQLDVLDRGLPEGERVLPWVALLTHGAPLGRLYEPLFPQVFGADALSAVRDALDRRWVNLWRDTDPIASQLSRLLDRRDRRCRDPAGFDLDGETGRYPPIRAHSDYPADPAYATARRDLLGDRGPAAEAATRIELPGAVQPGGRPAVPAPTPSPAPSR